jgi:hypothetical protein
MKAFIQWYEYHFTEIIWFTIGWLAMCLLVDFSKGDWFGCLFDIGLIAINYIMYKK